MTQVPTRIGRQRRRYIRQADAAHLVAVAIDGWNEMRIGLTLNWRQRRRYPVHGSRAEVETDHLRRVCRKALRCCRRCPETSRQWAIRPLRSINQVEGCELALSTGGPAAIPMSATIFGKDR